MTEVGEDSVFGIGALRPFAKRIVDIGEIEPNPLTHVEGLNHSVSVFTVE